MERLSTADIYKGCILAAFFLLKRNDFNSSVLSKKCQINARLPSFTTSL
ncbi:hypothetical protein CHCC20441_2556 [Bacillus licheniformis]|nr:hypothetical protein CHCC20441_2556 [Bacillus licheniformis]